MGYTFHTVLCGHKPSYHHIPASAWFFKLQALMAPLPCTALLPTGRLRVWTVLHRLIHLLGRLRISSWITLWGFRCLGGSGPSGTSSICQDLKGSIKRAWHCPQAPRRLPVLNRWCRPDRQGFQSAESQHQQSNVAAQQKKHAIKAFQKESEEVDWTCQLYLVRW